MYVALASIAAMIAVTALALILVGGEPEPIRPPERPTFQVILQGEGMLECQRDTIWMADEQEYQPLSDDFFCVWIEGPFDQPPSG